MFIHFNKIDEGKEFVYKQMRGIIQKVDTTTIQLYVQCKHMLIRIDNPLQIEISPYPSRLDK